MLELTSSLGDELEDAFPSNLQRSTRMCAQKLMQSRNKLLSNAGIAINYILDTASSTHVAQAGGRHLLLAVAVHQLLQSTTAYLMLRFTNCEHIHEIEYGGPCGTQLDIKTRLRDHLEQTDIPQWVLKILEQNRHFSESCIHTWTEERELDTTISDLAKPIQKLSQHLVHMDSLGVTVKLTPDEVLSPTTKSKLSSASSSLVSTPSLHALNPSSLLTVSKESLKGKRGKKILTIRSSVSPSPSNNTTRNVRSTRHHDHQQQQHHHQQQQQEDEHHHHHHQQQQPQQPPMFSNTHSRHDVLPSIQSAEFEYDGMFQSKGGALNETTRYSRAKVKLKSPNRSPTLPRSAKRNTQLPQL